MGRLTRGARYRLPPGEFHIGDLVIKIDPPKDEVHNVNSPIHPAPSQHTDDDRFGRHRLYLLQQYPHDKLKFQGHDDCTDLAEGQEPIRDVYGWYEVSEWPGAKQRLKETENFLATLKEEAARPPTDSSPDPFDDSEEDETFEPEEEEAFLPSEAHTIEEDTEGALYVPSPIKHQYPDPQIRPLTMGAFTPVKAPQRRFEKPKSVQKQVPEFAARRKAYNENITKGLSPVPNSKPEPRRDLATAVLAKLNAASQDEIDNGFNSPHSKRIYSKKERDVPRRSAAMEEDTDPTLLHEEASSKFWPRYRTRRTSHTSKKRKSRQEPVDDDERVVIMAKKKRRSTKVSQVAIYDAVQDGTESGPTQPMPGQKIYPPPCDPNVKLSLWPQYEDAASDLPEGYQVRVRFIPNADHVLPTYRKEQAQQIEMLVSDLVKNLVYYLLTLPNWRVTAVERGLNELKSQARNYILTKLKEIENIWIQMFNNLNVRFTLPDLVGEQSCPRFTAPLHKRNKANTSNNHTIGIPTLTAPPRRKYNKAAPPPVTNVSTADERNPSHAAFATDLNSLLTRQLTALLETIRFQTCIPKALWQRQSAKGTAQRRLYESNMRVAALAWQVGFLEGWGREIGRLRVRQLQKMVQVGGQEMRYWKQEVVGGRAGECEVVDLMTGFKEPLRQWEKRHGMRSDVDLEHAAAEDQHNEDQEEEGAIARSIRKAKTKPKAIRRRYNTSHQRLQEAMKGSPPDKNLEEHQQLQDELRRHQQQEQLRRNRCSQMNGLQATAQPLGVETQSLYAPGAINHVYKSLLTPQEQWEIAQDLPDSANGYNPLTGRYFPPGSYGQSYTGSIDAGANAGAGYMPLDPALAAFDVQQQQMSQYMQQQHQPMQSQQQYAQRQTATQLREQQQMQAQSQLPTLMTLPDLQRDRSVTVVGDGEPLLVASHGEMFTTPHGTAGARLTSSPNRLHYQDPSAEQNGMFYPSSPLFGTAGRQHSPMPAGPSSPLMFDRDSGDDGEHQAQHVHKANNALTSGTLQHLPDGATLARFRDMYERQGRIADANAIRALERGASVVVAVGGQLVVHENNDYGDEDVNMGMSQGHVGNVDGEFGAEGLGETGESVEQAKRRSMGDDFDGWKGMLSGET